MSQVSDYCVVGAGIVGMATALTLLRERPGAEVVVLEKELDVARHQTGHNSGVIHSGIYYAPGSLKARLCKEGARWTRDFCDEHGIPVPRHGKLSWRPTTCELARTAGPGRAGPAQRPRRRARRRSDAARASSPTSSGSGRSSCAPRASSTTRRYATPWPTWCAPQGGQIELGAEVSASRDRRARCRSHEGRPAEQRWTANSSWSAAGLQADRLARMADLNVGARSCRSAASTTNCRRARNGIVSHADLSRTGPRAAIPRCTPDPDDGRRDHGRPQRGARSFAGRATASARSTGTTSRCWPSPVSGRSPAQLRTGLAEMRNSLFKRGYLAAARRYCPSLQLEDLLPGTGRHPGPGGPARRHPGARLPARADRPYAARVQRALPRRDLGHAHRRPHRRAGPRGLTIRRLDVPLWSQPWDRIGGARCLTRAP